MLEIQKTQYIDGSISLDFTTDEDITGLTFFSQENFEVESEGIDLFYIFDTESGAPLPPTVDPRVFSVELSEINKTEVSGLFLFRFEGEETTAYGVCGNTSIYHSYVLNNLLEIDISNCRVPNYCNDFTDLCGSNVLYCDAMLSKFYEYLKLESYQTCVYLLQNLDYFINYCNSTCVECNDELFEIYIKTSELNIPNV